MTPTTLFRKMAVPLLALVLVLVLFAALLFLGRFDKAPPGTWGQAGAYRIVGPYNHDNLSVFLIHGEDSIKGKTFLTLQEAIEQKKLVVHETQQVNSLSVENVSASDEVFLQSGDIVKGGQQDRVLRHDLIVSAKSGKIPLEVFCVEAGRWTSRGREDVRQFNASTDQLNSNLAKIAVRKQGNQQGVWEAVTVTQSGLESNLLSSMQDARSATSLQLTLENKQLAQAVEAYLKTLSPIVGDNQDAIGYAFAINGKVYSADVYASGSLFRKLWPKLIKASAVEAVAELKKGEKYEPVAVAAVQAFLQDAEQGKASTKVVDKRIEEIQRETAQNLLYESRDKPSAAALHRSYIAK